MEGIPEYRSAIVDELGDIMAWCSDMSIGKIGEVLDEHPEWSIKCVSVV